MAGIMQTLMAAGFIPTAIGEAVNALIYDLDAANFSGFPATGGSMAFNGTTASLRIPVDSAFTYGTGDFTIEWWGYQEGTNGVQGIWRNSTGDTTNSIGFWTITQNAGRLTVSIGNGTSTDTVVSNDAITINTWNHYAFVRNGNLFKLYVNGVAQTSTLTSSINLPAQLAGYMQIGNAGGLYYGRISNFRIVKGTAVYTSNFTPSTRPLKAIPGTSLLLLASGNAPFVDSSTYAFTITQNGSPTYNAASPFSSVNDATGTYPITVNNAGSITYSSADGGSWIKSSNVGTDWFLGGPNYVSGQSYTVFMAYKLSATSAGRLLNTVDESVKDWYMGSLNGNPNAFSPNFAVNQPTSGADTVWHLDWATWDDSTKTGKLYTSTTTAPTNAAFTATDANGGGFNQLRMFNRIGDIDPQTGKIAFVKVYNYVLTLAEIQALHATYKSRFGYGAIGNIESTASPTLNGTTTITSRPYVDVAANSYSLNGTSNYLSLPASTNWAFGTGDFTVEWWQYMTSTPANPRVFQVGNYPTASIGVSIEGGTFYVWEASGNRFSTALGTGTYTNTWIHFAVSRVNNTTRVFRNGTIMGSSYADSYNISNSTSVLNIGQESTPSSGSYFPGRITSFRICKGVGVYSGNFTVPTSPLAQTQSANPYGGANTAAITAGQCVLLLNP